MSDAQNEIPCQSIAGIGRNIGNDGSTYQKVASACTAMLAASGFSRQSQIMPSTEIRGSEAISAPPVRVALGLVKA